MASEVAAPETKKKLQLKYDIPNLNKLTRLYSANHRKWINRKHSHRMKFDTKIVWEERESERKKGGEGKRGGKRGEAIRNFFVYAHSSFIFNLFSFCMCTFVHTAYYNTGMNSISTFIFIWYFPLLNVRFQNDKFFKLVICLPFQNNDIEQKTRPSVSSSSAWHAWIQAAAAEPPGAVVAVR